MSLKQLIKPATMVVSVVAAACAEFFRQHDCSGSSLVTKATQPSVVVPETRRYYSAALDRPSGVLVTATALLVSLSPTPNWRLKLRFPKSILPLLLIIPFLI